MKPEPKEIERLLCCALIRDGAIHKGLRSHSDLRGSLGDERPYEEKPGDVYGFWTSNERFVGRGAAAVVAFDAGQARIQHHSLLSSEIDWDGKPRERVVHRRGGVPSYEKTKSASLARLLRK